MADILTQIQDELDMLLNQMSLGLRYIKSHAPPGTIPGQPPLSSLAEYNAQQAAAQTAQNPSQPTQSSNANDPSQGQGQGQGENASQEKEGPVSPEQFQADIRELSRDLVVKEQQLEVLIDNLPGIGSSEKEQVARMAELERQLEDLEGERMAAVREKEELVRRVERGIMGIRGV